jgi:hypothetical protein
VRCASFLDHDVVENVFCFIEIVHIWEHLFVKVIINIRHLEFVGFLSFDGEDLGFENLCFLIEGVLNGRKRSFRVLIIIIDLSEGSVKWKLLKLRSCRKFMKDSRMLCE